MRIGLAWGVHSLSPKDISESDVTLGYEDAILSYENIFLTPDSQTLKNECRI